jgi:hypothetical protein
MFLLTGRQGLIMAYLGFGVFFPGFLASAGGVEAVFFFVPFAAGVLGFPGGRRPGFLEEEPLAFVEAESVGLEAFFCFPASLPAVFGVVGVADFLGVTASGF